jgi:hypothetical protein
VYEYDDTKIFPRHVVQIEAKPNPFLQVCQQSRCLALKNCIKFECTPATRCTPLPPSEWCKEVKLCRDIKGGSVTYAYVDPALDNIILKESQNHSSFDQITAFLGTKLKTAQSVAIDFCFYNGPMFFCQIRTAFNQLRDLTFFDRNYRSAWNDGLVCLQDYPAAKYNGLDILIHHISTGFYQTTEEREDSNLQAPWISIAEFSDAPTEEIRHWPLWKEFSWGSDAVSALERRHVYQG